LASIRAKKEFIKSESFQLKLRHYLELI
jgi:hypothetical protein